MKQNIRTVGEVEIDQDEMETVSFLYVKKDKKLIHLALQDYLKELHNFDLKKIAYSEGAEGKMVYKCEVESIKTEVGRPLFVKPPVLDRTDRKIQEGGHKKPNTGFYTVLMSVLKEVKATAKDPMDAEKAYKEMLFDLPKLDWRNFTIYCSDKRRQEQLGFVYKTTGRKKTDKKWLYAKK